MTNNGNDSSSAAAKTQQLKQTAVTTACCSGFPHAAVQQVNDGRGGGIYDASQNAEAAISASSSVSASRGSNSHTPEHPVVKEPISQPKDLLGRSPNVWTDNLESPMPRKSLSESEDPMLNAQTTTSQLLEKEDACRRVAETIKPGVSDISNEDGSTTISTSDAELPKYEVTGGAAREEPFGASPECKKGPACIETRHASSLPTSKKQVQDPASESSSESQSSLRSLESSLDIHQAKATTANSSSVCHPVAQSASGLSICKAAIAPDRSSGQGVAGAFRSHEEEEEETTTLVGANYSGSQQSHSDHGSRKTDSSEPQERSSFRSSGCSDLELRQAEDKIAPNSSSISAVRGPVLSSSSSIRDAKVANAAGRTVPQYFRSTQGEESTTLVGDICSSVGEQFENNVEDQLIVMDNLEPTGRWTSATDKLVGGIPDAAQQTMSVDRSGNKEDYLSQLVRKQLDEPTLNVSRVLVAESSYPSHERSSHSSEESNDNDDPLQAIAVDQEYERNLILEEARDELVKQSVSAVVVDSEEGETVSYRPVFAIILCFAIMAIIALTVALLLRRNDASVMPDTPRMDNWSELQIESMFAFGSSGGLSGPTDQEAARLASSTQAYYNAVLQRQSVFAAGATLAVKVTENNNFAPESDLDFHIPLSIAILHLQAPDDLPTMDDIYDFLIKNLSSAYIYDYIWGIPRDGVDGDNFLDNDNIAKFPFKSVDKVLIRAGHGLSCQGSHDSENCLGAVSLNPVYVGVGDLHLSLKSPNATRQPTVEEWEYLRSSLYSFLDFSLRGYFYGDNFVSPSGWGFGVNETVFDSDSTETEFNLRARIVSIEFSYNFDGRSRPSSEQLYRSIIDVFSEDFLLLYVRLISDASGTEGPFDSSKAASLAFAEDSSCTFQCEIAYVNIPDYNLPKPTKELRTFSAPDFKILYGGTSVDNPPLEQDISNLANATICFFKNDALSRYDEFPPNLRLSGVNFEFDWSLFNDPDVKEQYGSRYKIALSFKNVKFTFFTRVDHWLSQHSDLTRYLSDGVTTTYILDVVRSFSVTPFETVNEVHFIASEELPIRLEKSLLVTFIGCRSPPSSADLSEARALVMDQLRTALGTHFDGLFGIESDTGTEVFESDTQRVTIEWLDVVLNFEADTPLGGIPEIDEQLFGTFGERLNSSGFLSRLAILGNDGSFSTVSKVIIETEFENNGIPALPRPTPSPTSTQCEPATDQLFTCLGSQFACLDCLIDAVNGLPSTFDGCSDMEFLLCEQLHICDNECGECFDEGLAFTTCNFNDGLDSNTWGLADCDVSCNATMADPLP